MKLIELGGKHGTIIGNYAIVSDEDYEWLNQWKWTCTKAKNGIYAMRCIRLKHLPRNCNQISISMHRQILDILKSNMQGDHINGDTLNNQRSNLRIVTHSQNMSNRKGVQGSLSKYKGVFRLKTKSGEYWYTKCKKDGKSYCKYCKSEVEAALQYNDIAIKLHGEYAKLNIIEF